jgi:hypothetical protein
MKTRAEANPQNIVYITYISDSEGARGSVVVKALCCKPERGSSPDEVDFLN